MNSINAYKMTYYQLNNCGLNLLTTFKTSQDWQTIHDSLYNTAKATVEQGSDPWEQATLQDLTVPQPPESLEDVQGTEWPTWNPAQQEELSQALQQLSDQLMEQPPLQTAVAVFTGMTPTEEVSPSEDNPVDLTAMLEGLQVAESD
jgi:hypothetical protein